MSLRRERDDPGTLHDTGEAELRQKGADGSERVVKLKLPGMSPLGKGKPGTRGGDGPPGDDDPGGDGPPGDDDPGGGSRPDARPPAAG
jgi:hypothetical protein